MKRLGKLKIFGVLFVVSTLLTGCASTKSIDTELNEINEQEKKDQMAVSFAERAEVLYQEGDLDSAKNLYLKALENTQKIPMVYYRLGNIAYRQKAFEDAAEYFSKVIELKPRESKAYYNLAVIHLMKAEDNFKYFAATADMDNVAEKRIVQIIGDIERFSNNQVVQKKRKSNPLDKLAETLIVDEKVRVSSNNK